MPTYDKYEWEIKKGNWRKLKKGKTEKVSPKTQKEPILETLQITDDCTVSITAKGEFIFSEGCPERLKKIWLDFNALMDELPEGSFAKMGKI